MHQSPREQRPGLFSVEVFVDFVALTGRIGQRLADVNGLEALVRFSWHEFERLGRLELARSIPSEDLSARHNEFLHRRALREVHVRQWNPKGIGAGGGVEEQYLVLLVPNRAPECR